MTSRRICVALTTRGNYAKMRTTMEAIEAHPALSLQLLVGGALLDREYGDFPERIRADGFEIDGVLDYIQPGKTLESVAASSARCLEIVSESLARLRPDYLMIVADRYECLSLAQAALCLNIRIAHLEGGEVSGSIDERIRHAITKLAHIHFPANQDAAARLARMGEAEASVFTVGASSLDQLADLDLEDLAATQDVLNARGVGADLRIVDGGFVLISQHPVATEFDAAARQFAETVEAVRQLGRPTVWIAPNDEAGAEAALAPVRALIATGTPPVRMIGGLGIADYAALMRHADCLIGNSSSGLREAAYLGVPAVNIGGRQRNRARGPNVIDAPHEAGRIVEAARLQMARGRLRSDSIYGDGRSGEKIAMALASNWPDLDKAISY